MNWAIDQNSIVLAFTVVWRSLGKTVTKVGPTQRLDFLFIRLSCGKRWTHHKIV